MSEGNASEPGRPRLAPNRQGDPGSRQEVEETKLSRNRRGVGRAHSTREALEQTREERGRRAWREGARTGGRWATTHAPDSVPDRACHWRRTPADRNYRGRQALNADHARPPSGARCGKAARRDLRGGREVIPVPTATQERREYGSDHEHPSRQRPAHRDAPVEVPEQPRPSKTTAPSNASPGRCSASRCFAAPES